MTDVVRTQIRLPIELHNQVTEMAERKKSTINKLLIDGIKMVMKLNDVHQWRLMYNQIHDTGKHRDFPLQAAGMIQDYFARHPQYRLVNIESLSKKTIRWWYYYPIDADGKEIE